MKNTFLFYVNFPRFSEKIILIHLNTYLKCRNGDGLHSTGSNEKGFWAGPFNKHIHASIALSKLISKFENPPETGYCNCVNSVSL